MSLDDLGPTVFARTAPQAYWAAAAAFAVCAALALGSGARRWAAVAGIVCSASVVAAPGWGWLADLALSAALAFAAWRRPSVRRAPRASPVRGTGVPPGRPHRRGEALLLGRTARLTLGARPADWRVRLDGRHWDVRVDGPAASRDALVRVMRIEADGRLVVRAALAA